MNVKVNEREKKSYKKYLRTTDEFLFLSSSYI